MDAGEIEKCMDHFGTDIYRFCLKLCADKEDAEDLYQQTFLKALEKEWTPDWEKNPKALFFSLAHNLWKATEENRHAATRLLPAAILTTKRKWYCIRKKALKKIIFRKKCSQKSVRLFRLSRKNSGYRSYYFTFPIVP